LHLLSQEVLSTEQAAALALVMAGKELAQAATVAAGQILLVPLILEVAAVRQHQTSMVMRAAQA
jgi:hypothetical protein